MAHNTTLDPGTAGDSMTTVDLSLNTYPTTGKLPASCLFVSPNITTAPTPVTDTNPIPVDGTVTVTQATGTNLHAVIDSGTVTTVSTVSAVTTLGNITGTVSLPTGASTAAKQPALGTAGTASTDVITVQGIASMTPIVVSLTSTTVTGTVAVTKSGTWDITNAGTFAVQAAVDELPAAAALSDNFANPTTTSIASMGMLWDGATWDRALGNATDGALVNLGANNDVTVTSGAVTVSATDLDIRNLVQATDSVSVGDGTNTIVVLADGADNVSNANNQLVVASMLYAYDGSTWDRMLGNSTDGLLVNLGANNDVTVTSGTVTASAGTNLNTSLLALEAGGNLAAAATSLATLDNCISGSEAQVDVITVPADPFGADADAASATGSISAKLKFIAGTGIPVTNTVAVSNAGLTELASAIDTEVQCDIVGALPAGANAIGKLAANSGVDIGDVDVLSIAAGTNTIGNVVPVPATSGGLTIFRHLDLDETDREVKPTAGQIYGWTITNFATTTRYIKFVNLTAANTTVGSSAVAMTIPVPGNATDDTTLVQNFGGQGIAFDTAITVYAVTGLADNDTGAPGASDVAVTIFYK